MSNVTNISGSAPGPVRGVGKIPPVTWLQLSPWKIQVAAVSVVAVVPALIVAAFAAALAGYETGKVDFATLLDAQRQIRKAKQDVIKAQAEQQGWISRDWQTIRPTERGFDFLSDLQSLFLP